MATNDTEIVFEDLHGVIDDGTVEVDLDIEDAAKGIVRRPADAAPDDEDEEPDGGTAEEDEAEDEDDDDLDREDEDDGDDDEEGDEGDDAYSRRVRARIRREKALTAKERERAAYWEKVARDTAKRLGDITKETAEQTIKRASSEIEAVEAQLEAAIEAGNTKEQVALTSRLTDLKAEVIQAKNRIEELGTGTEPGFDDRFKSPPDDGVPRLARRWMDKNADWYGAKGFERQTRLANRIDKEVFADGYDPNTPEYYRELDRRLRKREPSLFDDRVRDRGARRGDVRGRRRQSPVAGVSGADGRSRSRSSRIELTPEDFANMRRFGLDTNDPNVLKEYARNKSEAEGGRR